MKRWLQQLLLAVLFGLGIPGAILAVAAVNRESPAPARQQQDESAKGVSLTLLQEQHSRELPLEEYLLGVLLQELPGDFHQEAIMAQAIAARTYALRTVTKAAKHSLGTICTNSSCCQAYISPEEYISNGGDEGTVDKFRQGIADTQGLVVYYGDELIDATYFDCSGGHTEDALAVWGADIPYLQGVESPGEQAMPHTLQMSAHGFYQALALELSGPVAAWLGETTYTQGGGIATMTIGGKTFSGTQLRSALDLQSTAFTLTAVGDTVTITTRGFGHRVGLSQQGAQAMALSGSSYRQILAHYYTGTRVGEYDKRGG